MGKMRFFKEEMGMYLRVSKKWQFSLDVLMIVVGTVIMGFSFSVFLEPNSITTGGFSGLSMIICELFSKIGVQWLSTSVVYLVLNVILFVFAVKALGKRFAIKAIVGILSFSGAMELFALLPINIQYETLISAVYGGAIMGVGLGIVVRFGGSTGGSDLVASIIRIKKPQFTMGRLVVMIDFVVIFLSLFVFKNGIELLPYTIMALLLSLWTTDFVNEGYKQVRAYSIITKKPEEVADVLMNKLSRGCTVTKVVGMHTKEEQYVLTCLVSKFQTGYLKRLVHQVDENAFVYSSAVGEVMGVWTKGRDLPVEEKVEKKKK